MKPIPTLLLSALVSSALSPANAAEVQLNGHAFTLPDGFMVERIPGTEAVARPVSASFDDQGALYVTDSAGVNLPPSEQLKNPQNRILRLIDADGDGRYERSTVFADRVMFPQGCLWHGGSVFVAAPPSIWKFTDTDGDGVADRREEWYKGKVLTGCANDVHGPYLGPEGYLYWTKGAFERLDLEDHRGQAVRDRAAHVFRARADGSQMEVVMSGGMDNPVEVAFLPDGEPILISTFLDLSQPGRRDGLAHAVYGGVFGKINGVLDEPGVRKTGDLLPAMTHYGPAAACALMRYEGEGLGREYADNLFGTLFNLRKVTRHVVVPRGATYATEDSDFLVSDQMDFHPTDVLQDIDGSLVVVDTGGWYKLCCPSSQLAKADVLGAIYRVRRADAAERTGAGRDPQVRTAEYARLVGPPSLAAGDPVAPLKRLAVKADPADAKALREVLARNASATATSVEAARLTRVAAEGLGRMGDRGSVPLLFEALARADAADRFLEHSLVYALIEIGDGAKLREGLASKNSAVRRAALFALEQAPGGNLTLDDVLPALRAEAQSVREAARWVLQRHADWGPRLTVHLSTRLGAKDSDTAEKSDWEALLPVFTRSQEGRGFLAESVAQTAFRTETRVAALRAMAGVGGKEIPPGWADAVAGAMDSGVEAITDAAVDAVRALPLPKEGSPVITRGLRQVASSEMGSRRLRLKAAGTLPAEAEATDSEWRLLREVLSDAGQPSADRLAAASAVSRLKLSDGQRTDALEWLPSAGPLELPKLVAAYAGRPDAGTGERLVAALRKAKGLRAIRPEDLRAVVAAYPESVRQGAEAVLESLQSDASKDRARLDALLGELKGLEGSVRRGQAVFNGQKAACATCHRLGYLGGDLGPDLTAIGTSRSERDLLEALMYPSASFVRSYEPWIATDQQGDEQSGVLRRETGEEIVLASGPTAEVRIARANLKDLRPGQVSIMPAGLDEQLSRQELADLIAFLKNTKWGAN